MPRRCLPILLLAASLFLLSPAAPAGARTFSMDMSCAELSANLAKGEEWTLATTFFSFWASGWWSAMRNDPYINAWRVSVLSNAMADMCRKDPNTRVLDAVRGVQSMPPVPDDALRYKCRDFVNASPHWQQFLVYWLQGYYAYTNGNANLDTDYNGIIASYERICREGKAATMEEAALRLIKSPPKTPRGAPPGKLGIDR